MPPRALIDSGLLVAYLNGSDQWHRWAHHVVSEWAGPYMTTEANFSEVCHLLERETLKGSLALFDLWNTGLLQVVSLAGQISAVQQPIARYRDRRVDFADACLLVLAERWPRLPVITTDRADFSLYFRKATSRLVLPPA